MGGNDADQRDDLATFTDNYSSMLDELSTDDRRIIVSGLLPRGSVDLEPYNTRLKALCAEKDIDYIDHYKSFLLASGDIADSYFLRDRVHPNSSGIRKMLKNIDAVHGITNSHTGSRPYIPVRRTSSYLKRSGLSSAVGTNGRDYRNRAKYCHICLIRGHDTHECWFNGRSASQTGSMSR